MRPKGSPAVLEQRRRHAVAMLKQGWKPGAVAKALRTSLVSVGRWKKAMKAGGLKALAAKPVPGRPPKLDGAQRQRLGQLWLKGPAHFGYQTELWTLERIAEVIDRTFEVTYDPSQVWRILLHLGWSCQKPESRGRKRDEEAIARWRKVDWPRIKKAAKTGKIILFLDETGLMLQPLVRRTWAPKGQRPVMYCWERHDRLSVIAGLTLTATRHHVGLYFDIHEQNIRNEEVEAFIRDVRRQVRKSLIVIMDRLPAHRSAAKRLLGDGFDIEWLPGYAPDLNPTEALWSKTKYGDMANYVPDDTLDLEVEVTFNLETTQGEQRLLKSFFQTAELSI